LGQTRRNVKERHMSVVKGISSRWEDPRTAEGFAVGPPNAQLVEFACARFRPGASCVDLGCGALRNAVPLAELGYRLVGVDLSQSMIRTAAARLRASGSSNVQIVRAPMAPLPFEAGVFELVVAHGIWNLAASGAEFRAAVGEAARVARPGAGLFLFTFSRHTLPPDATPDAGETFVFSSWNGEPQCFLAEDEIIDELGRAGFVRDSAGPLTEYNRPAPGELRAGGRPVIYEGTFVRS
jgi:SAM-dependent methyltransferase